MFFLPVSLLQTHNIVRENIISCENIKPSLPTPQNLRNYNLSLLDQVPQSFWWPIILIFPCNKNAEDFILKSTKILKQSLSKLLTRFYPLAGRISEDEFSVDCNDEGFPFTVAKIKSSLLDFIKKNDQKSYLSLLPTDQLSQGPRPGDPVAKAQVNYFDNGGMAIGFLFSHKQEDGWIMNSFIKSWSQYAYGGNTEAVCPNYIFKNLFPQNKAMDPESSYISAMMKDTKMGKTIMRRYLFDSKAISILKSKSGNDPRLSKAEVVTAFLWKCFMEATGKLTLLIQGTELRGNAEPPFPENCFGNFWWLAAATSKYEDYGDVKNNELGNLVRKMRDSLSLFDNDFITRMLGDDGLAGYYINVKNTWGSWPDEVESLSVSGWYDFGLYNVDFGWGKPIWIYNCAMIGNDDPNAPSRNAVWLNDTKKGDGIEAWVTLGEQYMKAFDDNQELLDLVSVDPLPLDI